MRPIDADALERVIKTECNTYGKPTIDFESGKKVLKIIERAPTIELLMARGSSGVVIPVTRQPVESLISRYEHDSMSGVFMARPTEVVKVGEPLPNSEEITKALEKGEIYKRGFEDGYKRGKEEQPKKEGEWILGERNGEGYDYYCSKCMHVTNEDINTIRFCPHCGANMQ